jgi:hypothetical protein
MRAIRALPNPSSSIKISFFPRNDSGISAGLIDEEIFEAGQFTAPETGLAAAASGDRTSTNAAIEFVFSSSLQAWQTVTLEKSPISSQ